MSSKSKCGCTQKEREDFLKNLGFTLDHTARGSHSVWVHEGLKNMIRTGHAVSRPENILPSSQQRFWEVTLCGDPASRTWMRISRQANWIAETFQNLTSGSDNIVAEKRKVREEFRDAFSGFTAWKRDVKNWLKAGLPAESAPKPTVSYDVVAQYKRELGMP